MEARLEIAGLDEIVKEVVKRELKEALREVFEPILKEFKVEMVSTAKDKLLKKPRWDTNDVCLYANISKTKLFYYRTKTYKDDFPKPLEIKMKKNIWDRDEILAFFARHPELSGRGANEYSNTKKQQLFNAQILLKTARSYS